MKSIPVVSGTRGAERIRQEILARMEQIHELIKAGEYPSCPKLAKRFGISLRAAERHISWMRVNFDMPIEYDEKRRGYYYSRPTEWVPLMPHMTQDEMFGLVVAQKAVSQYEGIPAEKAVRSAFEKLSWRLGAGDAAELNILQNAFSFRPFGLEPVDPKVFAAVERAVRERRALDLTYRKGGASEEERRCFEPYHVACVDNRWCMIGHDRMRKAIRTFVLVRVTSPILLEDRFSIPEGFNPEDYLGGSLTTMRGTGDYHVVIQLDQWATDLLGRRRLHASQEVTPEGNGSRLELQLNNLEEIERWVLSLGLHARVMEPVELRERLRRIGAELNECYGGHLKS